jgi:hypothetical protein
MCCRHEKSPWCSRTAAQQGLQGKATQPLVSCVNAFDIYKAFSLVQLYSSTAKSAAGGTERTAFVTTSKAHDACYTFDLTTVMLLVHACYLLHDLVSAATLKQRHETPVTRLGKAR